MNGSSTNKPQMSQVPGKAVNVFPTLVSKTPNIAIQMFFLCNKQNSTHSVIKIYIPKNPCHLGNPKKLQTGILSE